MKTTAIICEYNPFHNGHKYHIKKTRELTGADCIIAIMSGNFVQRGEPAVCDKFLRAKMALLNGADIVIELPVVYATSSAEYFAHAGITIANACAIADSICFGSESGDIEKLKAFSLTILQENGDYKNTLRDNLDNGMSFAAARSAAIAEGNEYANLSMPNDILAAEYLKALNRLNSPLIPFTVTRAGSNYHSTEPEGKMSSATAIRQILLKSSGNDIVTGIDNIRFCVPDNCSELLKQAAADGAFPNEPNNYFEILRYRLASMTASEIAGIMDISEGLENRIIRLAPKAKNYSDLISLIKTKRYAYTRISRALLHIILGVDKQTVLRFQAMGGPQYIRVLGFRKDKHGYLGSMAKNASLPIIINIPDAKKALSHNALEMLTFDARATDIYNLGLPDKSRKKGYEYSQPVIVV